MNYALCYVAFHGLSFDIAYNTEEIEEKYRRGFDIIDTSQGSYVVFLLSNLEIWLCSSTNALRIICEVSHWGQ